MAETRYRWTLGPPEKRFYWTVVVNQVRYTPARVSVAQCGIDPLLRISLATDLECIFRRYKPAHTYVIFDYTPTPEIIDESSLISMEVP
jgi:uncharacterized protein YmfQ (DUF2313 family)